LSGALDSSGNRGGSFAVRPGLLVLAIAASVIGGFGPGRAHAAACCVPFGALADSVSFLGATAAARSHFGILAVSLDRGDTLLGLNPDARFIPASNMKLFVTGAFLRQFGTQARGVTEVRAAGKLKKKHGGRELEMKGDLILAGSGYPDVVQLLRPGSRGLLDSLAYLLRESGLRKFEGTLWVDGTLFAPEPYGPGWAIDDMAFSYGAPLNAILANGNGATVVATATDKGVTLALDPPETPLTLTGRLALADSNVSPSITVSREPGSHVLRVGGRVPRGGIAKRQVAVPDPDSTAGLVLLGAMGRAGIEVHARVAVVPPGGSLLAPGGSGQARTTILARLLSPQASDVVAMVDAYSLNAETEALLRLLDPAPTGKTGAQALRRLTAMLADAGVDTLDVSFVDGSGLSPLNLATARSFVTWLQTLARDPALGSVFRESLAAPGAVGTLQKRFQDLGPNALLRSKTGTLTNVSALSGYVMAAGGERVAFSILSNGNRGSVAAARAAEEAIVGILSRFTRESRIPEGPSFRMVPR
jgi:D-alanyl-D-alanine carboxypeptidase/D-alanyl-D-alanine-endopeptidase (penicillin-binding protein 4)